MTELDRLELAEFYEAAQALLDELGGYLGDYARRLRELGYG